MCSLRLGLFKVCAHGCGVNHPDYDLLGGHFDLDEHSQQMSGASSRHSEVDEPTQTREQKLSQEIQELKIETERTLTSRESDQTIDDGSAPEAAVSQQDDQDTSTDTIVMPLAETQESNKSKETPEEDLSHYGYLDKKGAGLGFWKYQTRCKHLIILCVMEPSF